MSRDHVHVLVSCPPTIVPSEIMRRMKERTSSKLLEEFPHLKKKFWGRHFWARGYFCATVGQMTEERSLVNDEERVEDASGIPLGTAFMPILPLQSCRCCLSAPSSTPVRRLGAISGMI